MPLPERHPIRMTISITKSDYAYIKSLIEETEDSVKTVPSYVRRLVRHYVWSLREAETVKKSEAHLRKLQEGLAASPSDAST